MPVTPVKLEPEQEQRLAATIFNQVWELLEKPERSAADDDQMLHGAHASRYHWGVAGEPVYWARGEWQCSRVYAVLGRFEPALHHAGRCLELAAEHGLGPFDIGVAHEAIARSYRIIGDTAKVAAHIALGQAEAAKITNPEDQALLQADLSTLTPP
jgi:hypothetical protein